LSSASGPGLPFVSSVFHPTDFSKASEVAFAHALVIALIRQTRFWIFHAGPREMSRDDWTGFPGVRATLERWGLLGAGAPRSAVFDELQIRVTKVAVKSRDPVAGVVAFLRDHEPDMMVLATEGREGLPRWLAPSMAETLARRARTRTLFVPAGKGGFVSAETGRTSLRRILIPVDHEPDASDAVQIAARAAEALGDAPVRITLLHVGEAEVQPSVTPPSNERWTLVSRKERGDPVDAILGVAREEETDLLVMATEGRTGVLDAMRGTVTERVLRGAPCPLLAVPGR
jgi:nucleotide-binding universal stress UspA family protein